MMKTFTLSCVRSKAPHYINFMYDSTDPDIIIIKMGSTRIAVKTSELAEVFIDLDPIFAEAIEKDAKGVNKNG